MSRLDEAKANATTGFPRVSGDEPPRPVRGAWSSRFPRVSGDEPVTLLPQQSAQPFSPRERG